MNKEYFNRPEFKSTLPIPCGDILLNSWEAASKPEARSGAIYVLISQYRVRQNGEWFHYSGDLKKFISKILIEECS